MKNIVFIFLILLFPIIFTQCGNNPEKIHKKSTELMSTQSLGLAYLEEFKLDDAEREFIKFIKLAPKEKLGYANLGLTYLRMGKYTEAEKQLLKAIKIDPKDPDTRLILATVYQMDDHREKAVSTLLESLEFSPGHVKTLYNLTELYAVSPDTEAQSQRGKNLKQLLENAPANLVPHLSLIEIYIIGGELDKALEQLEIIYKQFPEFPKEAVEYYDNTLSLLKKGDSENALTQFTIFHNYLKVTSPYQAGIMDLKGPGGSLIGFPIITFDRKVSMLGTGNKSILDVIKINDATITAGLDVVPSKNDIGNEVYPYNVKVADYDGDGDLDLYVSSYDQESKSYKHYLFNNDLGRYKDVSAEVGLTHTGKENSAVFADFDNDGFLDIFILREGGDILYKNTGNGIFKDVSSEAKIGNTTGGQKALFVDLDHDGDLDLFEIGNNANFVFRNNGDGTFKEMADDMGLALNNVRSLDAAYGDFNDDGVIDIIVTTQGAGIRLFLNQRQGNFKDVSAESGLPSTGDFNSVAVGDYNNDGFSDLLISSLNGTNNLLYLNKGNGSFDVIEDTNESFAAIQYIKVYDAKFFDFDNDGFLDIVITGKSEEKTGASLFLYHNEGDGNFANVSKLLPADVKPGRQVAFFDYNDDGDLDIIVANLNGGISLLRNDGGNMNHYVKMKLVGLRAGSAKNNHFGIGAKVEIRAGDLYQSIMVSDPNVHFGLGNRTKADIIRITWTNGVPQNIFMPGADQALIEAQTLKGSCPFLYTWNGTEYVFAKDIIWRSALGMPLGIMGGTTKYGFADASDDYLKIPGELLKPKNGKYSVQVTSELWETIYIDQIQLVAVDHPDSVDIFVPEQFSPPPFPGLKVLQVKEKCFPVSAKNNEGNDVLALITEKDDKYVSGFKPDKYQGTTEIHELILDPGKAGNFTNLHIFLTGWIFPTDASINVALSQSELLKVNFPVIQVVNKSGVWETVVDNMGFPMGKDKTVVVDLTGKFLSTDHRVKIETNMEIYWDQIFFAECDSKSKIESTVLDPVSADFHYRGFSRMYRKGGRYGPHWFDYSAVDKDSKWRDLIGNYTRYGDVNPLLLKSDNKYIISNAGDEISIEFETNNLPELKTGWKRDFLVHSVGWVKDGDLNTALGNTVEPLPYHDMISYPPLDKDTYPQDPDLQKYLKEYNTRVVTQDDYRNSLKKRN